MVVNEISEVYWMKLISLEFALISRIDRNIDESDLKVKITKRDGFERFKIFQLIDQSVWNHHVLGLIFVYHWSPESYYWRIKSGYFVLLVEVNELSLFLCCYENVELFFDSFYEENSFFLGRKKVLWNIKDVVIIGKRNWDDFLTLK